MEYEIDVDARVVYFPRAGQPTDVVLSFNNFNFYVASYAQRKVNQLRSGMMVDYWQAWLEAFTELRQRKLI